MNLNLFQTLANGVGAAGRLAAAGLGVATAASPLLFLGLGKCKNYFMITLQSFR